MNKSTHRGCGIGTLLIKASLQIAKVLEFLAMQFNMVLSQNSGAIKLYNRSYWLKIIKFYDKFNQQIDK